MKALAQKMRIARNASDTTVEILDTVDGFVKCDVQREIAKSTLRAWYRGATLCEAANHIQPMDDNDPMRAIDIILDNAYSEPVSNKTFAALLVICGLAGVIAAIFLR